MSSTLRLPYVAGIDGLRAIAVLAVIVFHVEYLRFLPGGFTGVDMFFVISGYVISRSLAERERWSLRTFVLEFYQRRLLRLLPGLLLVLMLSVLVSALIVPPVSGVGMGPGGCFLSRSRTARAPWPVELDGTAQLLSREEYYPFGGTACWTARNAVEANYKTVRYSGKERDASGLYYYGLRYYAPWLQRWINPDPGGVIDGLNLYRMVGNNPITLRDEQGLQGEDINALINKRIHRFEGILEDKSRQARNVNKAIENERRPAMKRWCTAGRAAVITVGAAVGYAGGGIAGAAVGSLGGPVVAAAAGVVGTLAAGEAFGQAAGKLADQVGLGAPLNIMSHSFDWDYESHEQQDFKTLPRRIKDDLRNRVPRSKKESGDFVKDVFERALPFAEPVSRAFVPLATVPAFTMLAHEAAKGPKSDEKINHLIGQGDLLVGYINLDFGEITELLANPSAQYPSPDTQFKALPKAKSLDALERSRAGVVIQIHTAQDNLRNHLATRPAKHRAA